MIRDGDQPPVGNRDSSRQYDSWDGDNTATEDEEVCPACRKKIEAEPHASDCAAYCGEKPRIDSVTEFLALLSVLGVFVAALWVAAT